MAGNSNSGRYANSKALRKRALTARQHLPPEPRLTLPDPPASLSEHGQHLWTSLGTKLIERGLIDHLSLHGFVALIMSLDLLAVSHQALLADPSNTKAKGNWATAQSNVRSWSMAFGLLPSARGRVVAELAEVETDELEEFLK